MMISVLNSDDGVQVDERPLQYCGVLKNRSCCDEDIGRASSKRARIRKVDLLEQNAASASLISRQRHVTIPSAVGTAGGVGEVLGRQSSSRMACGVSSIVDLSALSGDTATPPVSISAGSVSPVRKCTGEIVLSTVCQWQCWLCRCRVRWCKLCRLSGEGSGDMRCVL